jgi:MFS family permease
MIPFAGTIVDRLPRRPTVIITQAIQMILAFVLFALTYSGGIQVWHIVILAFLTGITNAIYEPARQILIVEIVGQNDVHSGIALNSILGNTCRIIGPMAAGVALVQVGPAWCFFINAVSFLGVIAMLGIMKVPYPIRRLGGSPPIEQMMEGFRFARKHELIAPLLLLITIAGSFLSPVTNMLPAFADVVLHSPDQSYAALTAGQGVGAVIAGFLIGWLATRYGYGRLVGVTVILAALATILLAGQTAIPTSVVVGALCAFFTTIVYVSINTMLQIAVPDVFRGRVLSLYTLSWLVWAPFGALLLGLISNVLGIQTGLLVWGIIGILLSIYVLLRWPGLIELNSDSALMKLFRSKGILSLRRDKPKPLN